MKVAIYSPYLDTFGGGEKYMMTIAEVLSPVNTVDVLLDRHLLDLGREHLKKELSKRFDLNLDKVRFTEGPVGKGASLLQRLFFLKNYDVLFYLTDGSIFYPTARKNILHIQTPLAGQPVKSAWGRLKLNKWNLIIYNSEFTKTYSEKNWPLVSQVIYPPVDTDKIKPLKKRKYILSVGRFFGFLKDKKHEVLIKTYRELFEKSKILGWSLHLAGSAQKGDEDYLRQLKKSCSDLPVNFYPNIKYNDLIRLYGESSIYWHASGFDESDPTKMEHFGISTVEAMAGGCVPVVINKGGQPEIIENGKSGFLWDDLNSLKKYTLNLIEKRRLWYEISANAIFRSKSFSKQKFAEKIKKFIQ